MKQIKTQLLDASKEGDLKLAISLLKQGRLVAVPTETVYGLAANAADESAVNRIYEAKKRPAEHPLIVHIGHTQYLSNWAIDIPPVVNTLLSKFWPGPLTLILKKNPSVNSVVTAGQDSIGLRMPDHPKLLELLKQTGLGIAAPSANPYGQLSPTNAQQVLLEMDGKIDAVLDGGQCRIGLESTILDVRSEPLRILRAGPITASEIEALTGIKTIMPLRHTEQVSGNVAAHYQPNATLKLFDTAMLLNNIANIDEGIACVVHSKDFDKLEDQRIVHLPAVKQEYARRMYKTLYELDQLNIKEIWLEKPPQHEEWQDVNDRLGRAASNR